MSFLGNDAINRVNLHSGVQSLAMGAGGIFFFVVMLRAGISVPVVLLVQAGILASRFALRPLMLPLAVRWGVKPLLIAGTICLAAPYLILTRVEGVGGWLMALIAVTALGEILYYLAYNAYFAAIGDSEHRGHQVAAREALVAVISIAAPVAGTWGLVTVGPGWTFFGIAIVQASAAIPLIGLPNVSVVPEAPGAFRAARFGMVLMALDGWFDVLYIIFWQMALFLALGGSYAAYGGAMVAAGLVSAVAGLWLGRSIDLGRGQRAVAVAYLSAMILVLFRAASLEVAWFAVAANALGALLWPLLIPTLAGATYNLAKASPCVFRFNVAGEAGWDAGGAAACLAAAVLTALGVAPGMTLLLALPAAGVTAALLWRFYAPRLA